jgi:hypothetical protein
MIIVAEAAMGPEVPGLKPQPAAGFRSSRPLMELLFRVNIHVAATGYGHMDGHELAHLATRSRPQLRVLQLSGREPRRDSYPMIRKPFTEEDLANTMRRTTGLC